MSTNIDILGLGYAAVDDLLYVDAYPAADAKMQVRRRERHCGGLAATALVAAARMECRCAYAGTLGEDDCSRFVMQRFHEEGVETSYIRQLAHARPVQSTIVVDQSRHTRTILFDAEGVVQPDASWPPEEVIHSARVLLVDNCGVAGMIHAASVARAAGIAVVADFENAEDPLFPQLLALVDHLILSRDFALKLSGQQDPRSAIRALWAPGRWVVAITCGKEGCWYASDQQQGVPTHQPALAVEAVDTTGCGDVFHGAYAAALVHGLDIPAAVRFATVAAGVKATCRGGQLGIPKRAAVEARMATMVS
jgi:sulfofructose kinase